MPPPSISEAFRKRMIQVQLEGPLSQRQLGVLAGTAAKKRHQQLIADGVLPLASMRYVDGVQGAPETAIRITETKPGIIEYKGSSVTEAAAYVWTICREASNNIPKRASQFPAGTFANSWRVFVNGYEADPTRIPMAAGEIIIVNITPYSRFLEQHVGLHRQRPAYMITEIARRAATTKFQGLSIRRQFVTLPPTGGAPFPVPYVLQGRESRWVVLRNQRKHPRPGRGKGGVMTYPAVVIATKGG